MKKNNTKVRHNGGYDKFRLIVHVLTAFVFVLASITSLILFDRIINCGGENISLLIKRTLKIDQYSILKTNQGKL